MNPKTSPNTAGMAASAIHAALVTSIWVVVFKFGYEFVGARIWLTIALLWYFWLIQAIAQKGKSRRNWLMALGVGLIVLLPTYSTQYTIVMWAIEGFAP